MTASTPIVRYYDHLRFVYEVESRMKELRRTSETQQQRPAPSQNQNQNQSQPDGETHRKDGGTKLNPNDAPQQTVNPPAQLWGGDTLEAKLRLEPRVNEANGASSEVSGLLKSAFFKKSKSAARKGSKPCSA
jgi:hypothetical protein